ncbi:glycosyltransferase family 4 protein [Haloterrigena sp. SYSU A558-1]|uniref:Glycosyltransferase family 4 protein n=1 Tax=Haloterrigena gelatinilytica TaxID=2741724 RepID=A0A8J8GNZ0_9EURY|nr:glycosyltransferase family 4 protein [Haloterrigena gelatinilytica]NUB90905.1 glycosyltransferase family 4 protein [Haloterrigena gelatinilytica]NUC73276.1 glycosyltransferase family 4 protein [Haloterrigena gelatinilytica]
MVSDTFRRLLRGSVATSSASAGSSTATGSTAETGPSPESARPEGEPLDICLLSYRSNPYSGGQGVYVKYLSRALTDLGHSVDVISGKPYPELDDDVGLVKLPGENVVDELDRLGQFDPSYLRDPLAMYEWLSALTGGFPDPYAFGRRVVDYFEKLQPEYDVIHDNQSLCYGLQTLRERGHPVVATVHHPITVDRDVALAAADGWGERLLIRRWYRFLRMQREVVRDLPHVLTVSEAAKRRTVADFGADPDALRVVHNGIDTDLFEPVDRENDRPRVMTTVSADVPLKGARYLLEAFADVREHVDAELVVVGEFDEGGDCERLVSTLGIEDAVETHSEISYDRMIELYGTADVAVVPSLYEGFGLPAGEAMACGVPVVATTGGALPEVVGDAGVLVEPGDVGEMAGAIRELLADDARRDRLGERARERIVEEFDWERAARETVRTYRTAIEARQTREA